MDHLEKGFLDQQVHKPARVQLLHGQYGGLFAGELREVACEQLLGQQ